LELRDHPGQLRYLIDYGRTLLLLKDPKAQAVLAAAAAQVAAARNAPAAPTTKVQALLEYVLAAPAELTPGGLSRAQAIALALRWFPASPPLLYKIADLSFQQKDFRRAAGLLERLVQLGQAGNYDRSRPFDPGLIGDDAVLNLAACCRQLGELVRAEQCYRQLLQSRHFHAQAAQGLAVVQQALLQQKGGFSFDSTSGPLL
jgi:tetratricopeptide (TPR) repeat protein